MLRVFKKNELNGKWEQLSISDIEIDLDGRSLLDLYKTLTPRERQDFVYAMDMLSDYSLPPFAFYEGFFDFLKKEVLNGTILLWRY